MDRFRLFPRDLRPGIVLGIALAVQLALLTSTTIFPLARASWEVSRESALDRSADLSFGNSFSSYIDFIRDIMPEDALVVIPPAEHDPVFGHMGLMQFFLFPRRLTNCPRIDDWELCKRNYAGPSTYILSIDGFPPPDESMELKEYRALDKNRGIFIPMQVLP